MSAPEPLPRPGLWRRLVRKAWNWSWWTSMRATTRTGDNFVTYQLHPKRAASVGAWPDRDAVPNAVAIVMQGPIATENDFTLETLRLYRRQFPACRLILSTWNDTAPGLLEPIRALGVDVLLHEKPETPWLFNLNLHIVSASRGVQHAVAGGAEWVLKTRTDQRLCEPNVLAFLVAMVKAFPVRPGTAQRHRIVGIGHGTLKYGLYHVTDQTVFGHAQDMLRYWTSPLREAGLPAGWPRDLSEIFRTIPSGEMNRHASSETYFATQFLLSLGRELQWTLEDSWAALRDHFCVVDLGATGFYWSKVQINTCREGLAHYDQVDIRRELDFPEWLLLYSGQLPCAVARRHAGALKQRYNERLDPPT